jgi:hypothetical protein
MKKTNFFYHLLIVLGLCGLVYCGGGSENTSEGKNADSTGVVNEDSMNAAHQVDPSTAYPQPPVTGSNQDSTHTKDTANRPKY